MSVSFKFNAKARAHTGKGANRRLRAEGLIPAVIYGGKHEPQNISINRNQLASEIKNEALFSHIITLDVDGKEQQAIIKDMLRHPYKPEVLHLDFLRVSATDPITVNIPIHFIGEDVAPGVKQEGGIISHVLNEIEISCLPNKLPEFIEVDVSNLKLNESLHLSDLKLAKDITIVALAKDHNETIVTIHAPAAEKAEEEAAAPGETPEESSDNNQGNNS